MPDYLWYHKIDEKQDGVIQMAMKHWKKITGHVVDRNTMIKIIITQYGQELDLVNWELNAEERIELKRVARMR